MNNEKSLDELLRLGTTFCHVHQVDEPTTGATFLVCFECGHAYQTKTDLVNAYNDTVDRYNKEKPPGEPYIAYLRYNDDVRWCPTCDHSF